ncbi:MAG TPA: ImmA/IrrE family metallo-endopeptidase [Pyrinomonadaceae bacterium]|jgi:Zn-dependent peptidase ImmA (M78 family)
MHIPEILHKYGFGIKPLGMDVFEWVAAEMKIPVIIFDEKLIEDGISFPRTRKGKRFRVIALKNKLPFSSLAETAWHEFGHAFYEHYGVRRFVRGSEDRFERQADDLALCCIIPTVWVRTKSREDLLDDGFTSEQIDWRKWIYDTYKI